MKKHLYIILLAALSLMGVSCHKSIHTDVGPSTGKGYLVVSCTNCQIQYGMPDQYKLYSVSGTSPKYYFTYTPGYTLVTYITAFVTAQALDLMIYDANGNLVYHGSKLQGTDNHWETDTIVQPK